MQNGKRGWYIRSKQTTGLFGPDMMDALIFALLGTALLFIAASKIGDWLDPAEAHVITTGILSAVVVVSWIVFSVWLTLSKIHRTNAEGEREVLFALSPTAWARCLKTDVVIEHGIHGH